jgi:protein-L-isoaspartate(D-aspartate) O-methyltransferase
LIASIAGGRKSVPNWQREIEEIRTAYAKQVLAAVGVVDARLESAFSTTRREVFLGPGP